MNGTPTASCQRLCAIERVQFKITKSSVNSYYIGHQSRLKFALEDLTYAIFVEPIRSRLAFILSSRFNEWPDHIFPFFRRHYRGSTLDCNIFHYVKPSRTKTVTNSLLVIQTTNIYENKKNIFLNSTYRNSISFSDLLVTVWFDVNGLILHSKENFSDNLIFSKFLQFNVRINLFARSVGSLWETFFGWPPTGSVLVSDAHERIISTPTE